MSFKSKKVSTNSDMYNNKALAMFHEADAR